MATTTMATTMGTSNVSVLVGRLAGGATRRELADGRQRLGTTVTGGEGASRWSVPVVVEGDDRALEVLAGLEEGTQVVVVGHVRQRFFRAGGATASRTEVVAANVVPLRRRAQPQRLVDEVRRSLGPS